MQCALPREGAVVTPRLITGGDTVCGIERYDRFARLHAERHQQPLAEGLRHAAAIEVREQQAQCLVTHVAVMEKSAGRGRGAMAETGVGREQSPVGQGATVSQQMVRGNRLGVRGVRVIEPQPRQVVADRFVEIQLSLVLQLHETQTEE